MTFPIVDYQIFIILSIIIIFVLANPLKNILKKYADKRKINSRIIDYINPASAGIVGSIGWVIFSLGAIYTSALLITQLRTVGLALVGCLIVYFIFRKKDKDKLDADKRFSELSKEYKILKDKKTVQWIKTPEKHREILFSALENSKERLVILSGWVTDAALDNNFRTKLRNALERGVRIYIGYGYRNKNEKKFKRVEQENAKQHLQDLREWCSENNPSGTLYVCYIPNHSKILIVDSLYAIVGSFNWLSNSGGGYNNEMSAATRDKVEIDKLADDLMHQIENCPSDRRTFFKKLMPWIKH